MNQNIQEARCGYDIRQDPMIRQRKRRELLAALSVGLLAALGFVAVVLLINGRSFTVH
jgi:hypothetical protein